MKLLWSELIGLIIWFVAGVIVIVLGWTTFGETMLLVGGIGLVTWIVQVWQSRRQPAAEPPTSN
jgi:Flp pilus assembly protein TadB